MTGEYPDRERMYVVDVKESAAVANPAVRDLIDERGETITFETKREATTLAATLSRTGQRVRIQKAAPQDPSDADAYLIRHPERYITHPKATGPRGMTFDVGANQFGAIGESLMYGSYGLSPGMRYYLFEELDSYDRSAHRLRAIPEPDLPEDLDDTLSWSPDCLVRVERRTDGTVVAEYFCEIKTGNGSFERNQFADMRRVARGYGVLKIRVHIDALPAEYTVRIEELAQDCVDGR